MRPTIEKLRLVLVTAAVLLLGVVAVFLSVARHRARRLVQELPARLGADIQKETSTFTYSQAVGGRTVFTIHAVRAVQRVNGTVTLHDVGIVLYGRDQTRADRIYGQEFEYDQREGIVRAAGEVHLDLQAVAARDAAGRAAFAAGGDGEKAHEHSPGTLHARTSGLTYEQKTGMVTTEAPVEFSVRGITGHARGAVYDTTKNDVVLERDVRLSLVRNDQPMLLTAEHAVLDRDSHVLQLSGAHYRRVEDGQTGRNDRVEGSAREMRVTTSAEGRPEHAEASGGVTLANDRGKLEAPEASLLWNAAGMRDRARLSGGVVFHSDEPLAQHSGRAAQLEAKFDPAGRIEHATFTGSVAAASQTRTGSKAGWSTRRTLHAERLEASLGLVPGSRARALQQAVASGAARVELADGASGVFPTQTSLAAERMTAQFGPGKQPQLLSIEGNGQTRTERRLPDGSEERSSADSVFVRLSAGAREASPHHNDLPQTAGMTRLGQALSEAVERGNVSIHQLGPPRAGERESLEAHAAEATFGGDDQIHLSGEARVVEGQRTLRADRIDVERKSGKLSAQGTVQASYAQAAHADLLHVSAGRAEFSQGRAEAIFHEAAAAGAAGRHDLVRAWQGGSQIEAPTLILRQQPAELAAYGPAGAEAAVRMVISSGGETTGAGRVSESARDRGPLQISSGRLEYGAASGEAKFTGGVVLRDAQGSLRSDEAVAYLHRVERGARGSPARKDLQQAQQGDRGAVRADLFPAGELDHVEAKGGVLLRQAGREARGDALLYTAGTGEYLLTGTPSLLTDTASGTVRGHAIRFFAARRDVEITGDAAVGEQGRVRSELKVKTHDR